MSKVINTYIETVFEEWDGDVTIIREELVRCDECRYSTQASKVIEGIIGGETRICAYRPNMMHTTEPDGFCHHGERRRLEDGGWE